MAKKYLKLIKNNWWWGLIVIPILLTLFFLEMPVKEEIISAPILKSADVVETTDNNIMVDVKGYVNTPGIVSLPSGSRLIDAINAAGGLQSNADTNTINLSKKLNDEMVIIIYSKEEIATMIEGNTTIKYVDKECICPVIKNDACIEEKVTNAPIDNSIVNGKISINNGTLVELDMLPGIGPSRAQDIIDYRTTNGNFLTIEGLKNVSGIGDITFAKLKDLITL